MKKAWFLVGCLLLATAAVGCKDKCKKSCEHMAECMGGDKDACDKGCEDADDKAAARDAAKCLLDKSCSEIEADPTGVIVECAQ